MSAQRQFHFDVCPERYGPPKAPDALMAVEPGFSAHAASSPARMLQDELERALVAHETKWPLGYTALFLLVTCGGFWLGLGALVSTVF